MTIYSVSQGGVVNAQDVAQFYSLLTGNMTDQSVAVSNRIRAQLLGAQAGGGGYVGHSYSGPPTSASFVAGDYVIDQSGNLWICTASGSPGTWQSAGVARITSQTLGGPAATVSFTSIPATFTHLMLVCEARGDTASGYADVYARFNSDSGTNYARVVYQADDTTAISAAGATNQNGMIAFRIPAATLGTSANSGGGVAFVRNYADTTWKDKGLVGITHAGINTSLSTREWFGVWNPASAAAVNRIDLYANAGNIVAGSRFDLYGVP